MTQQQAVPAGWYRSPEDPALLRFWDGELWTERTRIAPHLPVVPRTSPDEHIGEADEVTAELADGEEIKAGVRGRSQWGIRRRWVAATEDRLLIVNRDGIRGWKATSIDYDDIATVGVIDACCAYITTGGEKISFTVQGCSNNESLADLLSYVRFRRDFDDFETVDVRSLPRPSHPLHRGRNTTFEAPAEVSAVDVDSLVTQIRKLDELRTDGLLTDDEFQTQKRKLLGQTS